MKRVLENPAPRWPLNRPLGADQGNWWVARVRPRNEKALAWDLSRMGIGYYLPMVTKRTIRRDNGKPRKSVICLFPGYVSIVDYPEHKGRIFRTGRVLKAIEVIDQGRFVAELENVLKAADFAKEVGLHSQLAQGQTALIVKGPLQGIQGIVTDIDRPRHIYLNVEMFNRAVRVSVSPDEVVPLEERQGPTTAEGMR